METQCENGTKCLSQVTISWKKSRQINQSDTIKTVNCFHEIFWKLKKDYFLEVCCLLKRAMTQKKDLSRSHKKPFQTLTLKGCIFWSFHKWNAWLGKCPSDNLEAHHFHQDSREKNHNVLILGCNFGRRHTWTNQDLGRRIAAFAADLHCLRPLRPKIRWTRSE